MNSILQRAEEKIVHGDLESTMLWSHVEVCNTNKIFEEDDYGADN